MPGHYEGAVRTAFDCRLRLVDTASFYEIEREVGRAVREAVRSGIRREDIFVQTKLNPSQYGDPERALKEGMMRLGLDYVDTAILHHPGANDLAACRAKERAVERGLARPIGLSNGYVDELTTFLPGSARVRRSFKTKFIPSIGKGTSFLLFGRKGSPCRVGRTPAQVVLRWHLERGVAVIPGSSDPGRIRRRTMRLLTCSGRPARDRGHGPGRKARLVLSAKEASC